VKGLLAFATLVAAVLGLGGVTWQVARTVAAPPDPLERKLADAKRYLAYVVAPDRGPDLRLGPDDRDLHFIAHAVLPGAPSYDPARQIVFGLRLILLVDGDEVWTHEIYTRARQSKAGPAAGIWQNENSFVLEPGVQLSDDRLLAVHLPDEAVAGAVLRLRLVGDAQEGLVRVYQRAPRAEGQVALRLRTLAPAQRTELADQLSFTPWDRLEPAERAARLRVQGLRLGALGREGTSYETRAVYATGFRLPVDEETPAAGTLVTPTHAAAVNVVGPVEVTLRVTPAPAVAPRGVPANLIITSIGEGGQPPPIVVPVPPPPAQVTQTLPVAAGLHSLQLATDARDGVQVLLSAPRGARAQFGPVRPQPSPEEPLAPDEVLLPGTVADVKTPPVLVAIAGPDDALTRIFRVDARLLPPPTPPGTTVGGEVTVETRDGEGRSLTRQKVQLASVLAPFEEVRLPQGPTRTVAEPTSFRLVAPAGARSLALTAAQPTLLRVYTMVTATPSPDVLEPPFDAVRLSATQWRYAPYDAQSWVLLAPENRVALAAQQAKLAAQTRLEPAPPPTPPAGAHAETVLPEGGPDRQLALERVRPEEAAAFKWTDGYFTALRPRRWQKVTVAGAAPVKIDYWVLGLADVNLGQEAAIQVDGETVATEVVTSTNGAWTLPDVAPGPHTLNVITDAPNLRLLVNQPPAGGGDIVALRSVYRLGGPLRVRVRRPAGDDPATVDVIVYAAGRDADPATQFRITLDGGAPRHAEGIALGRFSPGARTAPLPAADRDPILGFADTPDRTAYHPRLIAVGLGDDLAAGGHTLTIEPLAGAAKHTWVRFFVMTTAAPAEKAIQFRRNAPAGEGRADD
jgi:hypothetical protein